MTNDDDPPPLELPDVHFGEVSEEPSDWRTELADDDTPDDDELLPETPPDVILMLGFDPLEMEDDEDGTSTD